MNTISSDPALLVGLERPDDASVYRLSDDIAVVQTVDFFTPIVDDPADWGRIAAANALSDVYAMGGSPKTALNLVGWPRALDFALLGRVLAGGEEICSAAGVVVVGGHSVDDPEPKFGLSVMGIVHPERIVTTSGARPGDALILTKALGTGIISSGLKDGLADPAPIAAAIASMTALNRDASEAMIETVVSAATDVTGFGFIGHLLEMLGPDLDAQISASQVPVLVGALDLAARGISPGGSKRNRKTDEPRVGFSGDVDEALRVVLFDAQTSGGLLIAVAEAKADGLLAVLHDREVPAARVGELQAGTGKVNVEA